MSVLNEQHLKNIIKDKITNTENPYITAFVLDPKDCGNRELLETVCNSLTDELGFRFKIDFQPECCYLRARKIPDSDRAFQLLKAKNAFARASI